MEYLWIAVAYGSGLLVKEVKLPPLVGYLAAGFVLHAFGFSPSPMLDQLADLGVLLLLFTIGLKLNLASLFKPEVWAGALGHMAVIVAITCLNCLALGAMAAAWQGLEYFSNLSMESAAMIGLAVSFSSTVCAVKILEERGEMRANHGRLAIGILVIQDIVAVIFVALSAGKVPSIWALGLIFLPLCRPLLIKLLNRSGHGELLPLAGFFLALAAGALFEALGLKAHLGALVIALVIAGDIKAAELAKSLMSFKDLFLIGFFLSIGFTALPTIEMMTVALIMAIALPVKALLFLLWLSRFKLRIRTAFLSALALSNYSEFGLIVCAAAIGFGFLEKDWLVIMALAVSISFVFSAVLNIRAHDLYSKFSPFLKRFQHDHFNQPEDVISAKILIIGMGRVGSGAYDYFVEHMEEDVCGIEVDLERVVVQNAKGRNVKMGDAEDPDFWTNTQLEKIDLVMLAIPQLPDVLQVKKQLRSIGYQGKIACVAAYDDDRETLLEAGVDVVFNYYTEVGSGFAEEARHLVS